MTGHRDWKMLRRYTNLRPESLHPREKVHEFAKAKLMPEMLAGKFPQSKVS